MSANPGRKLSQGVLQRSVVADAKQRNLAPARVMRWVAASAFFELLNLAEQNEQIDAYLVKGGFAVELRQPRAARTSEDIDLVLTGNVDAVSLLEALLPAKWDSFEFRIKGKEQREHAVRVDLQVTFNQITWCTLKIDVLDDDIAEMEHVDNVDITKYQLPRVGKVAVMSRPQQISEWIHCTTKPAQNGKRKNRARNLIDIFVLTRYAPCDDADVLAACQATFSREGTHEWPPVVDFPEEWIEDVADRLRGLDLEVDAEALCDRVARYIVNLVGLDQPRTLIDEFRARVAAEVEAQIGPPADRYTFDGTTWRDGVLSLTIGENGGRPFVAYTALPSEVFGHRSSALAFTFDAEDVARAAAFIVNCLEDPYLH